MNEFTDRISFFDIDHTILKHASGLQYAREAIKRGVLKKRQCLAIPFVYFSYRYGRNRFNLFGKTFSGLKNFTRIQLEEIGNWLFEKRLRDDIFPVIETLIQNLKKKGSRIVLATASCDFIIFQLFNYLGADDLIATVLEFDPGINTVTTGRFLGKPVIGAVKLEKALMIAEKQGCTLKECAFYTDSIHDLPLLLAVGHPVAVNPDSRLRKEAFRRGWEIMVVKL